MRCDAIIHDTNISHRINCFILLEARWTIGRAVIRTSWTLAQGAQQENTRQQDTDRYQNTSNRASNRTPHERNRPSTGERAQVTMTITVTFARRAQNRSRTQLKKTQVAFTGREQCSFFKIVQGSVNDIDEFCTVLSMILFSPRESHLSFLKQRAHFSCLEHDLEHRRSCQQQCAHHNIL